MDYMDDLHALCETISNEIADANEKIHAAGGKLSASDVDYIDKLTHTMKSIKGVMHMEDGYSGTGYPMGGSYDDRGSYRMRGSYRDGSYARGGRMNARRDSMGRYSRDDGMMDQR